MRSGKPLWPVTMLGHRASTCAASARRVGGALGGRRCATCPYEYTGNSRWLAIWCVVPKERRDIEIALEEVR